MLQRVLILVDTKLPTLVNRDGGGNLENMDMKPLEVWRSLCLFQQGHACHTPRRSRISKLWCLLAQDLSSIHHHSLILSISLSVLLTPLILITLFCYLDSCYVAMTSLHLQTEVIYLWELNLLKKKVSVNRCINRSASIISKKKNRHSRGEGYCSAYMYFSSAGHYFFYENLIFSANVMPCVVTCRSAIETWMGRRRSYFLSNI